MPKFKPGRDHVRVTIQRHWRFDQVGKVHNFEPFMELQYGVVFPDGSFQYFAAHDLVLAPHPDHDDRFKRE